MTIWKDRLGNPQDDIEFLKWRYKGASDKLIRRWNKAIQARAEISDDVDFFFNELGIKTNPEIKDAIKHEINKRYKQLQKDHFTYYGRRDVKEELIAMLCFYELEKYDWQLQAQFDNNPEKIKLALEGDKIENIKKIKKAGISPSFIPIDEYEYLIFDHKKMHRSFKDGIPEGLKRALKLMMAIESREIFEKVIEDSIRRYKEGLIRGVSANYLLVLIQFYVLERNGLKKLLKPYRELAKLWNIPYGTFNKKMKYLYEIDK